MLILLKQQHKTAASLLGTYLAVTKTAVLGQRVTFFCP
jgi:hypothetical protein